MQTSFTNLQAKTDKVQQSVNAIITHFEELKNKQESAILDVKKQTEEQIKKVNADFEELKNQQSVLVKELKSEQEDRLNELETVLKMQILAEMSSSFSTIKSQIESIENNISSIQERLVNKTFLDSSFFKISIASV